jgi:hypothetical protein
MDIHLENNILQNREDKEFVLARKLITIGAIFSIFTTKQAPYLLNDEKFIKNFLGLQLNSSYFSDEEIGKLLNITRSFVSLNQAICENDQLTIRYINIISIFKDED